jgi:hypothetical protein
MVPQPLFSRVGCNIDQQGSARDGRNGSTTAGSQRYRRPAAERSIAVYPADFANPAAGGHMRPLKLATNRVCDPRDMTQVRAATSPEYI